MPPEDDAPVHAVGCREDGRVFTLSPDEWDRCGDILNRPVRDNPRLAALLAEPSVLETTTSTAKAPRATADIRVTRNACVRPLIDRAEASGGERREFCAAVRRRVGEGTSRAALRSVGLRYSLDGGRRCCGSGRNGLRRRRGGSANDARPATRLDGAQNPQAVAKVE